MPWIFGGLAAAVLLGIAFAGKSKAKAPVRVLPPGGSIDIDVVEDAAARLADGVETAEDLVVLSIAASEAGDEEAAEIFAAASTSAPEAMLTAPEEQGAEALGNPRNDEASVHDSAFDEPLLDGFDDVEPPGMWDDVPEDTAPADTGPVGFDPRTANSTARSIANNIIARQYDYDRSALSAFQKAAGIAVDGVYGNGSRQALIFFLEDEAGFTLGGIPATLFRPHQGLSYKLAHPDLVRLIAAG